MSKLVYPHSLHIAQNDNVLFVVADADVDAAACELHGDPVDGRVAVVVGEEHLGLDDLRSVDTLFDGHRAEHQVKSKTQQQIRIPVTWRGFLFAADTTL